jgi:DNA-binding response OmpR family regulator
MTHSVLVVEDDTLIRVGLLSLLRTSGHEAVGAATVAQAATQLDTATPTHLLLDLNLPDGPGTRILRRLREQALPTRVALLTASIDTPLLEEARVLGIDALFIKPPDWDQLLAWVAHP